MNNRRSTRPSPSPLAARPLSLSLFHLCCPPTHASTSLPNLLLRSKKKLKNCSLSPAQTVQNEDYFCHAHNADGLVGVAFADADYPARAAFGVVSAALESYARQCGDAWRDAREDSAAGNPACEGAVAQFQDPAAADKLTAIQRDLDETKVVLHRTIESVLARGETLDALVDKSADLSLASQMFYKQARKTNSCCKMM